MPGKVNAVAAKMLERFAGKLHASAVEIITPFPERVPLSSVELDEAVRRIIERYEPNVVKGGLFPHQAAFLRSFAANRNGDFIITTATGSGKSLCFWSWILDHLRTDLRATAILCFPTQALMWGQAERMRRLSDPATLAIPGSGQTPYGGAIEIDGRKIGWTIWQGVGAGPTTNHDMKDHEQSPAFAEARIRIATLDKAHWSLFSSFRNKEFAARLRCFVLDEAHSYDGVFGANVHYFLKRLYVGSAVRKRVRPRMFLASATLSNACEFAASLLSLAPTDITHIADSTRQQISLRPVAEVPRALAKPPKGGLSRQVLLLDDPTDSVSVKSILGDETCLGRTVNAIYFSQSKFLSKTLAIGLDKHYVSRRAIIYDADLPPDRRRSLEDELNDPRTRAVTVLGTSALELGVDIEGLDVCLMDDIPPRRADLLQRIGRVGRRVGRPGLIVLHLAAGPHDRDLLDRPLSAFQLDESRTLPIPLHLESIRWRHLMVAFQEWAGDLQYGAVSASDFHQALKVHFGVRRVPTFQELTKAFADRYGQIVDMEGKFWVYKGFRAAAGEGKIPLRHGKDEIARIDDIAIFRDAHPGAVYLGHDRKHYRVVDYDGDFHAAKPESGQDGVAVGKWLKTIRLVRVEPEPRRVATRGTWEDEFRFWQAIKISGKLHSPQQVTFQFGIWDFLRRWTGYTEVNLESGAKRMVTLEEATRNFIDPSNAGRKHPFLQPFSYRTLGWQWDFGPLEFGAQNAEALDSLSTTLSGLLEPFIAAAVESKLEDLGVILDAVSWQLRVLDSAPGGNGLSEALLGQGRMAEALQNCARALEKYAAEKLKPGLFEKYLLALRIEPAKQSAFELLQIVRELHRRWTATA